MMMMMMMRSPDGRMFPRMFHPAWRASFPSFARAVAAGWPQRLARTGRRRHLSGLAGAGPHEAADRPCAAGQANPRFLDVSSQTRQAGAARNEPRDGRALFGRVA